MMIPSPPLWKTGVQQALGQCRSERHFQILSGVFLSCIFFFRNCQLYFSAWMLQALPCPPLILDKLERRRWLEGGQCAQAAANQKPSIWSTGAGRWGSDQSGFASTGAVMQERVSHCCPWISKTINLQQARWVGQSNALEAYELEQSSSKGCPRDWIMDRGLQKVS